jgi:hypothetical protein
MGERYTSEWAAAAADLWPELPEAPGAEGTVSLAVSSAPRREVGFHWRYVDGRAVEGGAGDGGSPELALTLGAADAPDLFSGRVEPSVAFMRGRLKASGDGRLLLAFLRSTTAEGFAGWRSRADSLLPGA